MKPTAAVGAGYSEPQGTGFQADEPEPAAAAAEAGDDWVREIDRKGAELAAAHIKDTIERCAQVADKFANDAPLWFGKEARNIAAAIRALNHHRAMKD